MNIYYVYAYLREKDSETAKARTPYYIGKGKDDRAYVPHRVDSKGVYTPKDRSRIVFLKENVTDREAKDFEIELIAKYGRKDLGSGILHNRTDGGEGCSNPSQDLRNKKSVSMMGKNKGKSKPAGFGEKISAANTGRTQTAEHIANAAAARIGKLHGMRKPGVSLALKGNTHGSGNKGKPSPHKGKPSPQKGMPRGPQKVVICPHCSKSGGNNMKRYHFDNCKLKRT